MKKKLQKTIALATGLLCLAGGTTTALAGNGGEDIEQLKRQMQQVIQQNQELTARVAELEEGKKGVATSIPHQSVIEEEIAKQLAEKGGRSINDYVTLSGLIEGEFATGDDYEGNNFNEFALATVELGLDIALNEWVTGTLLAKYEGGEENDHLFIDEGFVEVGNYDQFPLSLTAGKIYVPFGNFETNMIQDPMTLEIGEICDFGMNIGFEAAGMYGGAFAYNGMKNDGGSDVIKGYGAQVGYAFENDSITIDAGISYVGNIADSGGIGDFFTDDLGKETVQDQVGGLGVHAIATFGPVMVVAEYVTALDDFNDASADDPETLYSAEPSAWNLEIGYGVELGDIPANFAVGIQGTDEAVELGLPETRYIASASFEIFPATSLTFEYFYDTDYDLENGGTDENANTFTTQLAYEF